MNKLEINYAIFKKLVEIFGLEKAVRIIKIFDRNH